MLFPERLPIFLGFTLALLALAPVRADEGPIELQQARQQFQKEEEFALRPLRDRYVGRLQTLKRTLASKGDVRAAVAVQDEIDTVLAIANENAIRAKMVGAWTGQFKDGPRRYVVKADGTVDWLHPNGTPYITGRLLRIGKDFIFSWEQIEEIHRVGLTETGGMMMDFFTPKASYPNGAPTYRLTLSRSAASR